MLSAFLANPARGILVLAGLMSLVALGTAIALDMSLVVVGMISGGFLALGLIMTKGALMIRDMGAATALIGQAIAFTAAFQGHPWQIDSHMLFFALLACLMVLRSIPALLMATVITTAHHLSFSVFMPALIYPGADIAQSIARTGLHAVIVVMETAVLCATVVLLNKLKRDTAERNAELEKTIQCSEDARQEAERAKTQAENAREMATASQSRAESLLAEAQAATERSRVAEKERQAAQAEFDRQQTKKAEEQAHVVSVVQEAMIKVQGGDLTTRITTPLPETYEGLRSAFNDAVLSLDAVVSQVARQSENMKAQVQEINSAARDVALRTERQSQTLQQSTEALAGLTKAVQNTVTIIEETDGSAMTAQSNAKTSEAIVAETSQAMQAIQTESAEISQIVKVIDDISFQTNLLALNAGVEAARAGDAGRGFAVVASEVRGLAQRSSESATNIRQLIERSGKQVETGSSKIDQTVSSLSEVLTAVYEITSRIGKIAEGARAQASGLSDLNTSVSDLDATTQKNAAMFEETSAACTQLLEGAEALQALTLTFQTSDAAKTGMAA